VQIAIRFADLLLEKQLQKCWCSFLQQWKNYPVLREPQVLTRHKLPYESF